MNIQEALSRVCDDAERWNAQHGWATDGSGEVALKMVRAYREANPDLQNITIDFASFRGVYGAPSQQAQDLLTDKEKQ